MRSLTMLLLVAAALAAAADPLDEMVGVDQAQAMGLQKLSAEERATLARWIERHLEGRPLPVLTPVVSFSVDGATLQAQIVPTPPAAPIAPQAASVPPPTVGTVASFGLAQDDVDGGIEEIHAKVVGAFTGWDGQTVFKLDNGQVWRQSSSGTYRYKAVDPEVVIEKAFLGYKLRLVATKRSISVRRVK